MKRKVIFGDVQGCFDELYELILKLKITDNDQLFFVGDLIDRGPFSPEVMRFIMGAKNVQVVKGNHEFSHLQGGVKYENTKRQFKERGGKNGLPTYEEVLVFFKTLPNYIELPEAIIVHAGLDPSIKDMRNQREDVLMGLGSAGKSMFRRNRIKRLFEWSANYPEDAKPVIFGHTPALRTRNKNSLIQFLNSRDRPDNLFPIETEVTAMGYLTAVIIPENSSSPHDFYFESVKAKQNYEGG